MWVSTPKCTYNLYIFCDKCILNGYLSIKVHFVRLPPPWCMSILENSEKYCTSYEYGLSVVSAHDEFLVLMEEKNQMMNAVRATDEKTAVVRSVMHQSTMQQSRSVNQSPSMAIVGHHHHHHHHHQPHQQQQQHQALAHHLHHNNRAGGGGSLVVTDYRGEPAVVTAPTIILDSGIVVGSGGGGSAGRRSVINGCGGGGGSITPHMAVWHPRPLYPIPLPATAIWHHTQPHFPTPNAAFAPFIEVSRVLLLYSII